MVLMYLRAVLAAMFLLLSFSGAVGQGTNVTVHVSFGNNDSARVLPATPTVVWLSPVEGLVTPLRATRAYSMSQKDRRFVPHLLVIPVGSTVTFPNQDPFFHNVFSMFNGRRFDLGLYQAGRTQQIKVQWEGVSYIFCNIHPEMSAIIVSLATPFYTVSTGPTVVLPSVPPGSYKLGVWNEMGTVESLQAAERMVTVAGPQTDIGNVVLTRVPKRTQTHENKFGEPYAQGTP